jgi:hypothetical protein
VSLGRHGTSHLTCEMKVSGSQGSATLATYYLHTASVTASVTHVDPLGRYLLLACRVGWCRVSAGGCAHLPL